MGLGGRHQICTLVVHSIPGGRSVISRRTPITLDEWVNKKPNPFSKAEGRDTHLEYALVK